MVYFTVSETLFAHCFLHCQGFSPKVSLVLLIANTMRTVYWFPERFDKALLVQSVLLILIQLALLQAVAGNRAAAAEKSGKPLKVDWIKDFWNWHRCVLPRVFDSMSTAAVGFIAILFLRCCNSLLFAIAVLHYVQVQPVPAVHERLCSHSRCCYCSAVTV
jgi:hypothetical protein